MGIQPQATQAAPVYAPQTPTPPAPPTPTPTPPTGEGAADQAPHTPPFRTDTASPYATTTPTPHENWLTYEDPDYGFSISYPPEGWTIAVTLENAGMPEYVIKRRFALFGPQGARINFDIWINTSGLDLMEWFNEHQRPCLSREDSIPSHPNAVNLFVSC